ncbi:spoU rRNA methylase family protein [Lutibaculum baratangense AMV1]|uniref:SpoU rRNA methylase family protein n=1 Tax=Lutibaculum baratangense AMV1 TaxID=631454 RepID=V4RFH5_9HYPH|nr:spoU rRNA methylase family protein [Lutibaculum baratangense AMV1]
MGGTLKVPFARLAAGEDLVGLLETHGFLPLALSPRGRFDLEAVPEHPGGRALIFGAEGPGLPDEVMSRATGVRIGMAADFDSLNVATSSGIALYALTRPRGATARP